MISLAALAGLYAVAQISAAQHSPGQAIWQRTVAIDPQGIETRDDFDEALRHEKLSTAGYMNWFTGRWPYISFIGGMAMGNVSEDLEFFYEKPFKFSTRVLDFVMEGGGDKFGIRATIRPYRNEGVFPGLRSYLLTYRCDRLLEDYHPSYILVNGRRVWDSKMDPILDGEIDVPFWQDRPGDPVIDFVVDQRYTPESKGLALRMFETQFLGRRGEKVSWKGAGDGTERSPADVAQRFPFGLFPTSVDYWSDNGPRIDDLTSQWKPNFHPAYPTDPVWLSPFTDALPAKGPFHEFMVTYGGSNVLGAKPGPDIVQRTAGFAAGVLAPYADVAAAKRQFAEHSGLKVQWFTEESSPLMSDRLPADSAVTKTLTEERDSVQSARLETGSPDKILDIVEPFPPALSSAYEYDRGHDLMVFKNEEDPQYNILMSMARGAGRSYGKPFGFYWEQTHYPFPSLDFKLQACLLYYFSGGSWLGAEAENAPSFDDGTVAEWVLPYVKAQRFAMVHPARGTPIVPTAICWGDGDRWWVPYNPLGQMDTFQRSVSYDHATGVMTSEPAFVKPLPWMPSDPAHWSFEDSGHLAYFHAYVPELKGYNLLDVYFPGFGDAFTARIAGLLTGTPYGPVDFLDIDRASPSTLQSYTVAAFLGHASIGADLRDKLVDAATSGQTIVMGAQHIGEGHSFEGLRIPLRNAKPMSGPIDVIDGVFSHASAAAFNGNLYTINPTGWEIVASVGDPAWPILVRKSFGKGMIYVYLGKWMDEGAAVLRPLLGALGTAAMPLVFGPADDQLEYVAYRKGAGAWVAVFNHGDIPVGADRLRTLRATPPEPLCSKVRGPWKGEVSFRLDRLGLDPAKKFALYQVDGIDGPMFDRVVAGRETFSVRAIPAVVKDGVIRAKVTVAKRAEFVVAPPGHGHAVFFGPP